MSYNQFQPAMRNHAPLPYPQTLYAPPPQVSYTREIPQARVGLRDIPQSESIASSDRNSVPLTAPSKDLTNASPSIRSQVVPNINFKPRYVNSNIEFSVKTRGDNKAVVFYNVDNPQGLELSSKSLSFEKHEVGEGDVEFTFHPDGQTHVVNIINNGEVMHTFGLKQRRIPNANVTYSVESSPDKSKRYILAKDVDNPEALNVECLSMDFIKGNVYNDNNVKFHFVPDGEIHTVNITSNGESIDKFELRPESVTVNLGEPVGDEHSIHVENVYKPENLQLFSDRHLSWRAVPGKNKNSIDILYSAPMNSQVARIGYKNNKGQDVEVKNKDIVLVPMNTFGLVPPMSSGPVEMSAKELLNQPKEQTYYTPTEFQYGEEQGPPSDEDKEISKGNLVISGTSKAL